MKRGSVFVLALLIVCVSLSSCRPVAPTTSYLKIDYPQYASSDEMERQADRIVTGIVLKWNYQNLGVHSSVDAAELLDLSASSSVMTPYTVYQIKITQVIKGEGKAGDTLQVKIPGGATQDHPIVLSGFLPWKPTSEYLLYLSTFPNMPASLINPIQGVYELIDGKPKANPKNTVPVSDEILAELAKR